MTIRSLFLLMLLANASFGQQSNLLQNGDFSRTADSGAPAGWSVGSGQTVSVDRDAAPTGLSQALRVELVRDGGSSYGEVSQIVKAKPRTLYRLEGQTRSTKAGFAFLSVKLRHNRAELKRFSLPKSLTEWMTVTNEFSTEGADEIQVLCRWEQNAARGWLGQKGWFAGLRLVEVGPAPPSPLWVEIIAQAAAIKSLAPPPLPLKPTATDIYVTPAGAGNRDGTSWATSLPGNAPGVLQAAWDALAPGRSCRVGSGIYSSATLAISTGGTGPDKMKRLVGEDTGEGRPWFVGNWQPDKPEGGQSFVSLQNQAAYCAFENLQLARYQFGLHSSKGQHVGLRVRNCAFYELRWGIYLNGFAYADNPEVASHDIEIADCHFIHFTKSAIRFQAGNYDARILNCIADAGGKDWMKESFQICYFLGGDHPRRQSGKDPRPWAAEHDILFINCQARNTIYSKARYWQGDGYCAENDVSNLAFINCSSFDNADGGWDVKARNVLYVNCVSLRNKMNFRVWQHAFMYNCLSACSFKHGGSWTTAGLWTIGDVYAAHSTFHDNSVQQILADKKDTSEAKIVLQHCLVTSDGTNATRLFSDESRVAQSDTVASLGATDLGPDYVAAAASPAWTGEPPAAFDSRRFGPSRGYHSSVSEHWRSQGTDQLIRAARALLKHKGWEDFTNQVTTILSAPKHK